MAAGEGELYVYALADPGLPRTLRVLGQTLHTLSLGSIDVIVQRHRERVGPTLEALQEQHAIITKLVDRVGGLLPARFGSRISHRTLQEIVSQRESEILESLARVRGRYQMTIRVFGAADATSPPGARASTGTTFLKDRQARAHHVPPEVATIREALGSLAAAERVETGERGLRVTVFHLVSAENVERYKRKAAALQLAPLQVKVSGPWPAFAFAPELF
jgi:hypothetical protein